MRKVVRLALVAAVMTIAPRAAFAQDVGTLLRSIANEVYGPFFFLIACSSFIGGLVMLALGLMKLTRQGESRGGIWESGFAHLVAAALLISLPDAAGSGVMTVFGHSTGAYALGAIGLDTDGAAPFTGSSTLASSLFTGFAQVGSVQNCLDQSAPAACMARNIAVNAIPMATWMLFGMTFLIGMVTFASAIMDITRTQQNQGMPRGWLVKVVTSVLLLNSATLFTYTTQTLLGRNDGPISEQGLDANSSMLSYPVNSSIEIVQRYAELIGWCFTILAFFGAWAFVRGIFIVKASGEGRSNDAGFGKGLVFIVAGVLLANAKYSSCVVLTTMGGAQMGQGFCQ